MSAIERRIEIQYVDLSTIHPNPWNPNRQNERTYEAERESLRTYGFVVPLGVRSHPEIPGEWQIIDGEHRWKGAQDEGYKQGPVVVLDGFSEAEVRKLTLALNMHGDAELVPLGRLLVELNEMLGNNIEELALALPYDSRELDELLKLGAVDWDGFSGDSQQAVEDHLKSSRSAARNGEHGVFLDFDQAQRERYNSFVEIVQRERGDDFNAEEAVLSALSGFVQQL